MISNNLSVIHKPKPISPTTKKARNFNVEYVVDGMAIGGGDYMVIAIRLLDPLDKLIIAFWADESDFEQLKETPQTRIQWWTQSLTDSESFNDFRKRLEDIAIMFGYNILCSDELNNFDYFHLVQYYKEDIEMGVGQGQGVQLQPDMQVYHENCHALKFSFRAPEYEVGLMAENELEQLLNSFSTRLSKYQAKYHRDYRKTKAYQAFLKDIGA